METFIPMVYDICRKLGIQEPIKDSEEYGEGLLALVKYYPRLDGRGKPSSYLYPCIRGCILRARRRRMQQTGTAKSRNGLEEWAPFVPLPKSLTTRDPEPGEIDHLNVLPYRSRRIVEMTYIEGKSLRTIGQELGLACERVRQVLMASLKRLRREYAHLSPGL